MPPRPTASLSNLFAPRIISRALQTTAPLPPPATSLPPIDTPQASSSSSSSSSSKLPPLRPAQQASATELPNDPSSALSLLKSQSTSGTGIYITARLHSRTYLLHPRDILTLPTLKPLQPPGTTLSLSRILEVGSRDYSIRSPAAEGKEVRKSLGLNGVKGLGLGQEGGGMESLPEWMVKCNLTVLEHTKSPLETIIKTKRRKGYRKTIRHKQGWTRLRVGDIHLGDAPSSGA